MMVQRKLQQKEQQETHLTNQRQVTNQNSFIVQWGSLQFKDTMGNVSLAFNYGVDLGTHVPYEEGVYAFCL